jgi:molecular chaperone GrpE
MEAKELTQDYLSVLEEELCAGQNEDICQEWLPSVDLQTLLSEITALKAELRVETSSTRELRKEFVKSLDLLDRSHTDLRAAHRFDIAREERVNRDHKRNLAQVLIDILDRLQGSISQAEILARPKRRWWRKISDPVAISLHEGLQLSARRLEQKLKSLNVRRINSINQAFDAQCMEAIEVVSDPAQPEGIVVKEITTGYLDDESVIRMAQVVVNRHQLVS